MSTAASDKPNPKPPASTPVAKAPERVPVFLYHMKPPSLSRIRREVDALDEPRLRLLESERAFRF